MTVKLSGPNIIDEATESIITTVSRDEKSDVRVGEEDEIISDEVWEAVQCSHLVTGP